MRQYRIRPNYRAVRLGFLKLLKTKKKKKQKKKLKIAT